MAGATDLLSFGIRGPGGGGLRGGVTFIPNPVGIALLARTPLMAQAMKEKAEYVAEIAQAIAPRGEGKVDGHYADQITADAGVIDGKAGARVNARKFTSGWIEFGTSDTPAFAILRVSCDSAGLSLSGPGATHDDFMGT